MGTRKNMLLIQITCNVTRAIQLYYEISNIYTDQYKSVYIDY